MFFPTVLIPITCVFLLGIITQYTIHVNYYVILIHEHKLNLQQRCLKCMIYNNSIRVATLR